MVPCLDMANHASGDNTSALYETDSHGNAVLILQEGEDLAPNDEVTITYGDEKGACEMLFSYGFIEPTMKSARELFLDLEIPNDDPLRLAKKAVAQSAPGFRLFLHDDSTDWESSFSELCFRSFLPYRGCFLGRKTCCGSKPLLRLIAQLELTLKERC